MRKQTLTDKRHHILMDQTRIEQLRSCDFSQYPCKNVNMKSRQTEKIHQQLKLDPSN